MTSPTTPKIDRDKVLNMWADGAPASTIAAKADCSTRSVYRIAADAFFNGDIRGAERSTEARDLYKAKEHMQKIAEQARLGIEVSGIASKFDLPEHIVRAAIYLTTQAGMDTGLKLGA